MKYRSIRPSNGALMLRRLGIAPMVIINAAPTTMIKKRMTTAMIVMLGAVAFEATAAAEQKFQRLTGAQIQARFPGMELTDEAHWGEVFERNGTLTITSMGHKRQVADPERPALPRDRERTRWRLLRGVAVRKKRGAKKPGLECAVGSRPSKTCGCE